MNSDGEASRWKLQKQDLEWFYRPGLRHSNCGALSRCPNLVEVNTSLQEDAKSGLSVVS